MNGAGVLVVDDEPFVRDSIVEVLRADGWRAHAASGAREAVEFLSRQGVDVVVTDLRMPEGDAFLLLEHAKKDKIEVPIVVITGVGTVSEAVRAMKAGAYDFLRSRSTPTSCSCSRAALPSTGGFSARCAPSARRSRPSRAADARRTLGEDGEDARARHAGRAHGSDGPDPRRERDGKELAAEEIHRQSSRAGGSLVRLHCAPSSEELREGALRGGLGAFSRAEAARSCSTRSAS